MPHTLPCPSLLGSVRGWDLQKVLTDGTIKNLTKVQDKAIKLAHAPSAPSNSKDATPEDAPPPTAEDGAYQDDVDDFGPPPYFESDSSLPPTPRSTKVTPSYKEVLLSEPEPKDSPPRPAEAPIPQRPAPGSPPTGHGKVRGKNIEPYSHLTQGHV